MAVAEEVTVASCDHGVKVARSYGLVYPLTPCCAASGKGGEWGVICRSCYREVSFLLGDCVSLSDEDLPISVRSWLRDQGCTTPMACGAALVKAVA